MLYYNFLLLSITFNSNETLDSVVVVHNRVRHSGGNRSIVRLHGPATMPQNVATTVAQDLLKY